MYSKSNDINTLRCVCKFVKPYKKPIIVIQFKIVFSPFKTLYTYYGILVLKRKDN